MKDELVLELKNGISANDEDISAKSIIRVEVIFDQLTAGNEKILESIEENFVPTPKK